MSNSISDCVFVFILMCLTRGYSGLPSGKIFLTLADFINVYHKRISIMTIPNIYARPFDNKTNMRVRKKKFLLVATRRDISDFLFSYRVSHAFLLLVYLSSHDAECCTSPTVGDGAPT